MISSDCGMGRVGMSWRHATYKMVAMVLGTSPSIIIGWLPVRNQSGHTMRRLTQ